ncbi:MAG: 2-oxoacid:acceptor oxidoreductase subunit alpha, partial [Acetobacteraceae bacterium]|nr:2-oxoacid:acceptor oxidoreductase subunit alpha [Acetobacteraceae bacterium]
ASQESRFGALYYGSTSPAMEEAAEMLAAQGITLDRMRIRAFPFDDSVKSFIDEHEFVFVIEQNRDAQMRSLLLIECDADPRKLIRVLHYDGTPITARFIAETIAEKITFSRVVPLRKALP